MLKKSSLSVAIISVMLLAACGNVAQESASATTSGATEQTQSTEKADAAASAKDTESKEAEAPKETVYKVGQTFTLGDWEVKLASFKFAQKVTDDFMSSSAEEGNKFLILNYKITNKGTQADTFTAMIGGVQMHAMFQDKYEYPYTVTMINGDLSSGNINPLSSKSGFVVMEVPDAVAKSKDSLVLNLEDDDATATIQLR
ncbi:DUF4352 domain-containing protein [Paenibacillus sp. WLX1005]|uniref:DUF4352 domain-containing protein n=1 Tax=Paenibacillus sp. WLX1005 TaxID=3243766 RepID=UPI00398400AF